MNILTNEQIKRRGIAAVEDALRHGPVHLVKRNRPAAVVVTEAEFTRLSSLDEPATGSKSKKMTSMEWFLSDQPGGKLDAAGLARRIKEERDSWNER